MDYYFACESCSEITGPCENPLRPNLNCCARPCSEQWPSRDAIRLLDVAKEQLVERRDGRRVAAVFLAFAFERLLEEAVAPLLRIADRPVGQAAWQELFEARTKKTLRAVLADAGLPGFERGWKHLNRLRNQIAHGKYSVENTMDGSVLRTLHDEALPAFVALARAGRAVGRERSQRPPHTAGRKR